jgi:hypothetical protein
MKCYVQQYMCTKRKLWHVKVTGTHKAVSNKTKCVRHNSSLASQGV